MLSVFVQGGGYMSAWQQLRNPKGCEHSPLEDGSDAVCAVVCNESENPGHPAHLEALADQLRQLSAQDRQRLRDLLGDEPPESHKEVDS